MRSFFKKRQSEPDAAVSGHAGARVLIVDDSPTELHLMRQILEKGGYQVLTAENGEAGVAEAVRSRPDVILMDVVMPGLNGFQATRQLSREPETAGIPIIMVTTKGQETDRAWGLRQGAREYVVKPVAADELLGKIRLVMDA
ncbi:MAG TPA: response regulator [Sedimenticola thiotaurini]|uniref:Response regulator n=1 Tax=Sedimenticola thiotaurini TaxID=1543721 RepID=A0A831RKW3_9GAMM|nr:response regulator [Sedimenticola thiotaurini]